MANQVRRRVAVFGSTGSVGRQALEVARHLDLQVVGLIAGSNRELLTEQIAEWQPEWAVLANGQASAERIGQTELSYGQDAVARRSLDHGADLVVAAISGMAGLLPTWNAVTSGATIALANKESLVAAGHLLISLAKAKGATILPIDSEHSALWQCLGGKEPATVERLILTASGGPFRDWPKAQLARATRREALAHPTWQMGNKLTIDSATLMNKGLEVIEAHWLFDMDYDKIDVVVHAESIVHSLVEFVDGSVLAQLAAPDMRLPIQLAMTYPKREVGLAPRLELAAIGQLNFCKPRSEDFPCLPLAIAAGRAGKSYPVALNVANEVAVRAFQQGALDFLGISRLVAAMLDQHEAQELDSVSAILQLCPQLELEATCLLKQFQ